MNTLTALKLKIVPVIALLAFPLVCLVPVFGATAENIETTFSSVYEVDAQNVADVQIGIEFTNIGEYPTVLTVYDLNVGDVKPVSPSARSGNEELEVQVLGGEGTILRINLADNYLEVDETNYIEVSYQVKNFLVESGGTHEVEVPLFRPSDRTDTDVVTFSYPATLGAVNFASSDYTSTTKNGINTFTFEEIGAVSQLYISIGNVKYYSLFIERELANEDDVYAKRSIVIPPETNTQQLILSSISPFPDDVDRTVDGNYILTFDVPPLDTIWVRIQGVLVREVDNSTDHYLSSDEFSYYTDLNNDILDITDKDIRADIETMKDGSVEERISSVYDYTVSELSLSDGFRELHTSEYRKGAEIALKSYKNASAEDYADVFVALARELGIPSRVVSGYVFPYAVRANPLGMFHVWPQYWTSETGWVSVDPAYEAYSGLKQEKSVGLHRVYSALSYDAGDFEGFADTTSEIGVTDETAEPNAEIVSELELDNTLVAGSPGGGTIRVTNRGNLIVHSLSITSDEESQIEVEFDENSIRSAILPGETVEIGFSVDALDWYASGEKEVIFIITAESSDGTQRTTVKDSTTVEPLWWVEPLTWGVTVLLFLIFLVIIWGFFKLAQLVARSMRPPPPKINETML